MNGLFRTEGWSVWLSFQSCTGDWYVGYIFDRIHMEIGVVGIRLMPDESRSDRPGPRSELYYTATEIQQWTLLISYWLRTTPVMSS